MDCRQERAADYSRAYIAMARLAHGEAGLNLDPRVEPMSWRSWLAEAHGPRKEKGKS